MAPLPVLEAAVLRDDSVIPPDFFGLSPARKNSF